LPPFGFTARAGENEADITRRDGIVSACAKSPGILFVDVRPNVLEEDGQVLARAAGVEDLGNRRFRFHIDWQVLQPVSPGFKPFVHFVDDKSDAGEGILFQAGLNLDPAKLSEVGMFSTTGEATVPAGIASPAEIAIRFGLYHPGTDERRLPMPGATDRTGRLRGGVIHLEQSAIRWEPEPPDPGEATRSERLNPAGKLVDFGPVTTNGAFRLLYGGATNWQLIPLPGSLSFKVELRLNQLNASGKKIEAVTAVEAGGNSIDQVNFKQQADSVSFDTASKVFAYKISLKN